MWRSAIVRAAPTALGEHDGGVAQLRSAHDRSRGAWDTAFVDLHLAESLLRSGEPTAAVQALQGCVSAFESQSAGYWQARAHLLLAEAREEKYDGHHRALACTFDDGEAAFARLLAARRGVYGSTWAPILGCGSGR